MFEGRVSLCILASVAIMAVPASAADRLQPARTNPLLFDYFRQQLLESNLHQDFYGRTYIVLDRYALDRQAGALARDYHFRVEEKLTELEQAFKQVQSARAEALRDAVKAGPGSRAAWLKSLKRISDTTKKLHGMLHLILDGLHSEGLSAPAGNLRHSDPAFEYETKVMGEHILRLDQRIKGFLSGETLTVSVEELRDEGILRLLSRVQTEAAYMRENLDTALQLQAH